MSFAKKILKIIKPDITIAVILLFAIVQRLPAGAVLDVANSDIVISKANKRAYISLQNIGDRAGTFTVKVRNITDREHIVTYPNSALKNLPIFIRPILIYKLKPKGRKRITLIKNPRVSITSPKQFELVIKEYKKAKHTGKNSGQSAGIQVRGAIVNLVYVTVKP